ncbi:hypothetical protein H1O16_gp056 [Burkholderia phage BcepSaruman]|uniref:Uncharacterized protein n=1 Tax=Burkholderia phage BcepSaruman TaxID=2530032 RepID=A0A4D5ZCR1_9CAUD|nr:hypothetical protein H1O16_gp056 [Burkholderia phage BcepSaruman]QBX06469.1 hypothetical protein BcepSaruman_056 [Burkholderia phage BcepSaruman]
MIEIHNCFFIVDDVLTGSTREGFVVMHGDARTVVGVTHGEFMTLDAARRYIDGRTDEGHYRVWLARRHGKQRVQRVRPDVLLKNADGSLTLYALTCGYVEQVERAGVRVRLEHRAGALILSAVNADEGEPLLSESFALNELKKARAKYRETVYMLAGRAPRKAKGA